VLDRGRKGLGITLCENMEEAEHFAVLEIEVDDPYAATPVVATGGLAHLADAAATGHWSASRIDRRVLVGIRHSRLCTSKHEAKNCLHNITPYGVM